MRLGRWLMLVAVMVGMGLLQVAQRNAVFVKGYAVGERMHRVHTQATEVAWLHAEVEALQSPTHLAQVVQERHLKLVAWSPLAPPLVHLAAGASERIDMGDDTSD